MEYFLGIDIGSISTKGVIIDETKKDDDIVDVLCDNYGYDWFTVRNSMRGICAEIGEEIRKALFGSFI